MTSQIEIWLNGLFQEEQNEWLNEWKNKPLYNIILRMGRIDLLNLKVSLNVWVIKALKWNQTKELNLKIEQLNAMLNECTNELMK